LLPRGWLFPGRNPVVPLSTRQLNRAVHAAAGRHERSESVAPMPLIFASAARPEPISSCSAAITTIPS